MVQRDSRLVVKRRQPLREFSIAVALIALLVWLAWSAFDFGRQRAGYDSEHSSRQISTLKQENERLLTDNETLRERVAVLERGNLVDRSSYAQIESEMQKLQGENKTLRKELQFYEGIVRSSNAGHGVKVQKLSLEGTGESRQYNFNLVLMQTSKVAENESGIIGIYLHGESDNGEFKEIAFRDMLQKGKGKRFKFNFKYFQNITDTIKVPEKFSPKRVVVKVDPKGKRKRTIEQIFEWSEIVS